MFRDMVGKLAQDMLRVRTCAPTEHSASSLYAVLLASISAAGLFVVALPFLISTAPPEMQHGATRPAEASLLMACVLAATLIVILGDLTRSSAAGELSRSIALLAVLVAIDACLRLIPSFFGASPIFAL